VLVHNVDPASADYLRIRVLARDSGGALVPAPRGPWSEVPPANQANDWTDVRDADSADVYFADVNGDDLTDVVIRHRVNDQGASGCPHGSANWCAGDIEVQRSRGSRFKSLIGVGPDSQATSHGRWTYGYSAAAYELLFADVNGDGRDDLVARVLTGADPCSSTSEWCRGDVWVALSSRTFAYFESPIKWSYGWTKGTPDGANYELFLADVDGDANKRADLVGRRVDLGAHNGRIEVALSNGTGFAYSGVWSANWLSNEWELRFGDVTGDGKADLVGRQRPAGNIYVAPSTGALASGFRYDTSCPTQPRASISGLTPAPMEFHLADLNGDKWLDLVLRSPTTVVQATAQGDSVANCSACTQIGTCLFGLSSPTELAPAWVLYR